MKIELLHITENAESLIEQAGRTCYKSEKGNTSIIKRWVESGHESVIEHASATFRISGISRALTHQLVRHRIGFSYSQESQRYVNAENFDYVMPDMPESMRKAEAIAMKVDFFIVMNVIKNLYTKLIAQGIPKEDARYILPNAVTTEIVVTANFRALRNFFKLRCDKKAQWEIRELANEMLKICKTKVKYVFDDMGV